MRKTHRPAIAAIASIVALSLCCSAQTVNIWPGVAPGSENWKQAERVAKNTLPGRAPGAAVIIAPGGAFVAIAIDLAAHDVARWLRDKGLAAFVLKHRIPEKKGQGIPAGFNMDEAGKYAIADGIQALKVVRSHAREWNIAPDKVGFLAFSPALWSPPALCCNPIPRRAPTLPRPSMAVPLA